MKITTPNQVQLAAMNEKSAAEEKEKDDNLNLIALGTKEDQFFKKVLRDGEIEIDNEESTNAIALLRKRKVRFRKSNGGINSY